MVSTIDNNSYVSINSVTSSTDPSADPRNWQLYALSGATGYTGPTGTTGPAGTLLIFDGLWVSGTSYTANTVVVSTIDNNSYVSINALISIRDPSIDPTNWQLYALSGATGPTGPSSGSSSGGGGAYTLTSATPDNTQFYPYNNSVTKIRGDSTDTITSAESYKYASLSFTIPYITTSCLLYTSPSPRD